MILRGQLNPWRKNLGRPCEPYVYVLAICYLETVAVRVGWTHVHTRRTRTLTTLGSCRSRTHRNLNLTVAGTPLFKRTASESTYVHTPDAVVVGEAVATRRPNTYTNHWVTPGWDKGESGRFPVVVVRYTRCEPRPVTVTQARGTPQGKRTGKVNQRGICVAIQCMVLRGRM